MPLPKLSLSAKVFLSVTIPLVVQLSLLVSIASLERQAEVELDRATKARHIADTVNDLSGSIYELAAQMGGGENWAQTSFDLKKLRQIKQKIDFNFNKLLTLAADEPIVLEAVQDAKKSSEKAENIILMIHASLMRGGTEETEFRKPLWKDLQKNIIGMLYGNLLRVSADFRRKSDSAPEIEAALRQKTQSLLLAIGVINVALSIALIGFLTKSITSRLKLMRENTNRLAMGLPLHPVSSGSDDIAQLDQTFHTMAALLEEANRKERVIIENALDVICSLDENGKFLAINPAAQSLFGVAAEDLIGSQMINLIAPEDCENIRTYMTDLRRTGVGEHINVRMKGAAGEMIDTLWSASWSDEERSLFCVIHDVSESRRAERFKQELNAMITHDLRTPLTTLSQIVEYFDRVGVRDINERTARYIPVALKNVNRMTRLINDLLDVEKIKSGSFSLNRRDLNLANIFNDCEQANLALAEEANVKLLFKPVNLTVNADQDSLLRTMTNLVANAVHHSPPNASVTVSAQRDGDFACISVEDQGPGIPPESLNEVFERFHQVKSAAGTTSDKSGSGLGLTICRAIVQAHGGTIWVESELGKGSRFRFKIPLQADS